MNTLEAIIDLLLREVQQGQGALVEDVAQVARDVQAYVAHVPPEVKTVFDIALVNVEADALAHLQGVFAAAAPDARRATLKRLAEKKQTQGLTSVVIRICWLVIYSRDWARGIVGFTLLPGDPVSRTRPEDPSLKDVYDVCVVGSGAGGSVVAARAAQEGRKVLILEEGAWISPHELSTRDDHGLMKTFRGAGVQPALPAIGDLAQSGGLSPINVLQAKVVGGGPCVNNAIHLPMKPETWKHWVDEYQFPIPWDLLQKRFEVVSKDLGVNAVDSRRMRGERTTFFEKGAKDLGWKVEDLEVCTKECIGCGGCNLGCRFGLKTGGLHRDRSAGEPRSYLERALKAGARIRPLTRAIQVAMTLDGSEVRFLVAQDVRTGETLTIRARTFVFSAGPVASTLLLRQSGIRVLDARSPIGKRVSANVVSPVFAVMDKPVSAKPDPGLQMCLYVDRGGKLLETWFHYPGSLAVGLSGWLQDHVRVMRQYGSLMTCGVVVPTDNHGTVDPVTCRLCISLNDAEFARMKSGIEEVIDACFKAKAREVIPSTRVPLTIRADHREEDLAAFRKAIRTEADLSLATAHPQGGNGIHWDPDKGVVTPRLNVHGIKNLFVADASVFPMGCHVNPQMTAMALAHIAADSVLSDLNN